MFIRRYRRTKSGKEHLYWALVESYRTARGPRQRIISYLGELSEGERLGWARLGQSLDHKAESKARQLSFIEPEPDDEPVPESIEIRVSGVRVERSRAFGEVYLGVMLWQMLGLDELMEERLPQGKEEIPWSLLACLLTVSRLVHPSSELHVADTWYEHTVLPELLGVAASKIYHTRLYRTLDQILPLKSKIEEHLKNRFGELFQPDFEILLYDITSTYFEGECKLNPQAQRGYSRDDRPDTKQVCIALVVTREGFPLGYEIFAGNRSDVTTVQEIVETIEAKYGKSGRVWVMDRGMVSENNLDFLRERDGHYLVGTPKSALRQFEQQLLEKDWNEVKEGIEVKLVASPDTDETFVLCRSQSRIDKEKAIHQRFIERIETGLEKLKAGLARGKKKRDPQAIERQIGRLLQRNSRAAKAFKIEVEPAPDIPTGVRVNWNRDEDWQKWAELSEGCYMLRTNLSGYSPEELWEIYIQLTDVEEAFRIEKSDLKIRPIWHQLEDRVQAHILFSFLAYALWKTLQEWMNRNDLGRGVNTVLEVFSNLTANDIYLPTTEGREVHLCAITQPDSAQRAVIERLGILIPERIGRPNWNRKEV